MSKNLYFLISFVLVLALSGSVQAVTPLDVNNGSFEYDCDGNQIQREVPPTYGCIKGWTNSGDWFGAIIWCESPLYLGVENCQTVCPTDGEGFAWIQNNDIYAWQVTGSNYATNKLYTLLIDGQGGCNPNISLFSGTDPDANEVGSKVFPLATGYACESWLYDLKAQVVVPAGDPAVGQPIGIKIFNPLSGGYFYMDNVRLEEDWATNAYNPAPYDSEIDVSVVGTDLSWSPGLWVDKHRVYFSTDFNAVNDRHEDANKGLQDPNWYSPGTFVLSETYYWAVDEVNTGYVQGVSEPPAPPNGVWPGDVWSFETQSGHARDFSPGDGEPNVDPNVVLSWTKGPVTDCSLVYFSTSFDDVNNRLEDANQGCIGPNSFDPTPGGVLDLGTTYYWAVDEVNGAFSGSPFKSDVMEFTVINYLVVDDFDSYADDTALDAVWDTTYLTGNGAELFLETTPDYVIDGNSMRYYFRGITKVSGSYVGSEAEADIADLEVGPDWTQQGIEALVLNFYGDATNLQDTAGVRGGEHVDRMYVALEDGSANVGIVRVPDMNDIAEPEWHEWNISLQDPVFSDVNMADVAKIYIGFGGQKMGQSKAGAGNNTAIGDTVWFDDIRLYPPRCLPAHANTKAKGDFDENCVIDYLDLDNIGRDWLESGEWVSASPPDANSLLAWYRFDEGADQTVGNSGTGSSLDGFLGRTSAAEVNDPTWETADPCAARQRCLDFDGTNDSLWMPGFNLTTNTATYTAWVKRSGDQPMYTIIFASLDANDPDPNDPSAITLAGLFFGSSGPDAKPSWAENSELCYYWRSDSWAFQTGLIVPDGLWTFIGVTIAPDEAMVYMYDGTMSSVKCEEPHGIRLFDGYNRIGGWVNPKGISKFVNGRIDDARFYNYTLSPGEVLYLVDPTGIFYRPLEDWRADIDDDDKVDFKDYVILADNWLDEILWP